MCFETVAQNDAVTKSGNQHYAAAAPVRRDDTPATRPAVFLEMTVGGTPIGTLVIDVYTDVAPRCARAFLARVGGSFHSRSFCSYSPKTHADEDSRHGPREIAV
jgi:hypothetical protein